MKRLLTCLLICLSLIAFACSEEEKKSTTTTDTSGADGSTSGTTSDTTSGSTSGSTSGTEDVTTDDTSGSTSGTEDVATSEDTSGGTEDTSGGGDVDLCQNAPDLAYLAATISGGKHDGKTGRAAASSAASSCGLANIAAEDPKAATITCMQNAPENVGLTNGCTGCYGDIVLCTIEQCISKCAVDPSSTPCTDCQAEKGCVAAFDTCTGPLPE
jgi:hypothetical protein